MELLRSQYPMRPSVSQVSGRVVLTKSVAHLEDTLADPDYDYRFASVGGWRRLLGVPMMRDGISARRHRRRLGGAGTRRARCKELLKTFADQAVIAIENVRLFSELQARNADVTEALEQQTATAEILRIISTTPTDVTPVLEAVTSRAAQLCDAQDARLFLVDGNGLRYVAGFGELKGVRQTLPLTRGIVTGRAVLDQRVLHIEDLAAELDEFPDARGPQARFGHRTTLAVPLVRKNQAFGAILMRRREVRPFTDKQIDLVKTFADQATIAIENVRLFNEIQEKSQQLEVANRHKSAFLASMSHELRTPLNAIIGFSEVLQERMFGDINEKQTEYLEDIHSSSIHLLSLINDILDLAKIEAGRMDLELSRFDLCSAIDNALTLIRERATRNNIALKSECDPQIREWTADERKFKQILLNLLSNAVKFTPSGGTISVRARRADQSVEIAVADTGAGISPEDQKLVFEEFQQVGADRLKKSEGTGLGLALTRKFVELHGGTT